MSEPYRLENWQSGVSMACHAERVRLLFTLSRTSIAATLAATLLVAVWMWSVVAHGVLLVWLTLMFCNVGALIWMQRRYHVRQPRVEDAPRWERWFSVKTAAGGFLWGMAVWLLAPQAGEFARLFFILTLCTVCLGATAVLAPSRHAYYAFMAPLVFPALLFLLFGHPDGIAAAGWAVLIYIVVLAGVHDALHRNLVVTFRGRFESEALAAEHKAIFDSAAEAIGLLRPNYLAKCNRQWCALFGYGLDEAIGKPAWAWWPSYEDWSRFAHDCMATISAGKPYSAIVQLRRKNGELFWAEISGMAVDPANLDLGVVWMGTDISERLRTETELKASEQRFRDLVSLSTDWYWEQDADFRFTRFSGPALEKIGIDIGKLLGKSRWEVNQLGGITPEQWRAHKEALLAHQPFRDFVYEIGLPSGEQRWFSISGNPAFDENGDFAGYHGVGTDISERVHAAEQFRHLAHHDTLTGLPNRRLLGDRAEQALALARRSGHLVALLLLDLDDFKIINDTDGHSAGDTVLVAIAQRLRSLVREIDTVARLGGDEFVILLQEMAHPRDATRVAEKAIEAIREPVEAGGRRYLLGVSVGIAHFPDHAASMEGLMQKADIAMYRAKQAGGAAYHFADRAGPAVDSSVSARQAGQPPDNTPTH
ncbi:MAG: diguanylate cyclase [Rhodocyclales bacterium]|nr:diguanylate cyclase [Rhodocyclales bacterium]